MRYNMATSSDGHSVIVLLPDDGDTRTIVESNPAYVRVLEALLNGDDPTEWLESSTKRFQDQYEGQNNHVCNQCDYPDEDCQCELDDEYYDDEDFFEPEAVIEDLAETINRYYREGRDTTGLLLFMDRIAKNPSYRSREQLFQWTQSRDMTIDINGYIIGYKGVSSDLLSITAGRAFVDDEEVVGNIPNIIGTVISMPRPGVQDDPTLGCSTGLHVGSWDYASTFGPVTLEVRVDPADVVSVPVDCGFQKLRCCRYEVIAVHESEFDDLTMHEPEASWAEEDAVDSLAELVPTSFWFNLKARLKGDLK